MAVTRPRSHRLYWTWIASALVVWSVPAMAQNVYKWTDDHGVVHFADSPPSRAQNVEERLLRVPPVVTKSGSDPSAEGDAGTGEQAKAPDAANGTGPAGAAPGGSAAGDKPRAEGPARIVMVSSRKPRTGPGSMHITGEVRNVGGREAQAVAVTVVAVDATQGTQCFEEETDVSPGTLKPGETGNFDIDIQNPCLYGDANIDLKPIWE